MRVAFDCDVAEQVGITAVPNDSGLVAVSNGKGQQQGAVTPLLNEFVSAYDGRHPGVDVGCGYGLNTFAAIDRGCSMVAADMTEEHLCYVEAHWIKHRPRHLAQELLRTELVHLPETVRQTKGDLASTVLLSEVLHFLRPTQLQRALDTIWRALTPHGRVCIGAAGPDCAAPTFGIQVANDIATRQKRGDPWPGEVDVSALTAKHGIEYFGPHFQQLPEASRPTYFHIQTPESLSRACMQAGFTVLRCELGEHPGNGPAIRGPTSHLQVVAEKS